MPSASVSRAPPRAPSRAPSRAPGRPPGGLQAASGTLWALELPRRCALPWAPHSQRRRPLHSAMLGATWVLSRRPLRQRRHRPLPTRRRVRPPCQPQEHLIEYNRHPPCPYIRHRATRAAQQRPTSCPARRLHAASRRAQHPARRLSVASGALVSVPVLRARPARRYRRLRPRESTVTEGTVVSTRMQSDFVRCVINKVTFIYK